MKTIFCLVVIWLNCFFYAEAAPPSPPSLSGQYNFYGRTQRFAVFHLERIYTLFEEGQKREKELLNQGYICEPYTSNWTACQKLRHDLEIPSSVIQRLSEPHLGKLDLSFGETWAKPDLKISTEYQWSWMINQKIRLNEFSQPSFQYLKMDSNEKIFVGDEEFLLSTTEEGKKNPTFLTSISIDDLQSTSYYTYYLQLILEKKH